MTGSHVPKWGVLLELHSLTHSCSLLQPDEEIGQEKVCIVERQTALQPSRGSSQTHFLSPDAEKKSPKVVTLLTFRSPEAAA